MVMIFRSITRSILDYGAVVYESASETNLKTLTYLLGVASKQLRLLHGRVRDSTIVVNSLSPQTSELVEDAIAS